jgi:O-antigen ligase
MGNNMTVYFAKDALVGVTYLVFIKSARIRVNFLPPALRFTLGLFVLFGIVQIFNPNSPSLVYGALGLKLYLYYVPLIFVGYALLRTELDLRRLLFISMGAAGIIALVGIAQSVIGLDFLNPKGTADIEELGHLTRYTPSGVAVPRPPSVFVSDGRFAQYVLLSFILGLGTVGYLLLRGKGGRKLVFPCVGLVALASVMSGGRGCFVYVLATSLLIPVGLLWGAPSNSADTYRLFKAIRRAFIAVALALALGATLFPKEIGAPLSFYRETVALDSGDSETVGRMWDYPLGNFLLAFSDGEWTTGHGIGTASLGVQYVSRWLGQPAPQIGVESGYGTLVTESGILGLILWLLWTIVFIFSALKVMLRLKGKPTFPIALAIVWFSFLLLFTFTWGSMVIYQNFVLNAYFWLLAGVLFRLPTLEPATPEELRLKHARTR